MKIWSALAVPLAIALCVGCRRAESWSRVSCRSVVAKDLDAVALLGWCLDDGEVEGEVAGPPSPVEVLDGQFRPALHDAGVVGQLLGMFAEGLPVAGESVLELG